MGPTHSQAIMGGTFVQRVLFAVSFATITLCVVFVLPRRLKVTDTHRHVNAFKMIFMTTN